MWQMLCVWQQTQPGVISAWQSSHSLSCWEQPAPGLCCRDLTLTQTKQRLSRHQLLNKAPHSDYLRISSVLSQPETERVAGRLQGDVGRQIFTPASTKSKAQTPQSFLRFFLFQFPHHFEKPPHFFITASIRSTQMQQVRSINSASVCGFYLHSDVGHGTWKSQLHFLPSLFPFSPWRAGSFPSRLCRD